MTDATIRVEGLSKQYRIGGAQAPYKTIRESLIETVQAPFRRASNLLRGEAYGAAEMDETIWALKDISFEVNCGEVVGIIGHNGAGKTTLLKILSRITDPTEGYAEIRGRVGSLLEVGTGFHLELTGRENVYLNGAILGMTRNEIDHKFDEIVGFSGVEKFIDTPVKHYSSGMRVRLAFSVAAHLETEVLLIDEVLAVGDVAFQNRCLGKMEDVAQGGRTVLFVSHNMAAITGMCERALWLDEGRLCADGRTERVVSSYLTTGTNVLGNRVWEEGTAEPGVSEFKVRAVRIKNCRGEATGTLDVRRPFSVEIEYEILSRLPPCRVGVMLATVHGMPVFTAFDADREEYADSRDPGLFISRCEVPGNLLNPGRFAVSVVAGIRGVKKLARLENVLTVDIENTGGAGAHLGAGRRRPGVIRPKLEWQRERLE
ncbi:MAG: ABC transporter ATP-binding protein [bacterium]